MFWSNSPRTLKKVGGKIRMKLMTYLRFGLLLAYANTPLKADESAKGIFTKVYNEAEWGRNAEGEGFSGTGSMVEFSKEYMAFLQKFLHEKNIQTVVDIGCGDWQFSQHINWSGTTYKGLDVVQSVIDKNNKKFSRPKINFECVDVINADLPKADLMICKDVFQHLTNADVASIIKQIPKYKYCLITNDVDPQTSTSENPEILHRGSYRTIDMTKPPFNLKGTKILTYSGYYALKQVLLIDNTSNPDN